MEGVCMCLSDGESCIKLGPLSLVATWASRQRWY